MVRFTTLGALDILDADGEPLHSIVERPKRLALLAYLCLAGPGVFRSRDTILALFWPEFSQGQARAALNQSVYVLRRELGRDVVVSRGSEQLGIAPEWLWCDAVAFRAAFEEARYLEALELYRGELLPGLYISGAPEFEHWLDAERAGLHRRAAEAAWKLAYEEGAKGNAVAAARWAARSVELTADEEPAVRRAIAFLDGIGDRAGALQIYETFANQLADEFGVQPSAETQQLVANVRARKRLAAPATEFVSAPPILDPRPPHAPVDRAAEGSTEHAAGGPTERPAERLTETAGAVTPTDPPPPRAAPVPAERGRRPFRLAWPVIAASLVGIAIWMAERPRGFPADDWERPRVVIPPFRDFSAGDRFGDFAGALRSALVGRLTEVAALEVVPIDEPYPARPTGAPRAPPAASGRLDVILRGSVLVSDDSVQVTAVFVDEATGATIASASFAHPQWNLAPLAGEVATEITSLLREELGRELRLRRWRVNAESPRAWALLRRAEADRDRARQLRTAGVKRAAAEFLDKADSLLALAEAEAPDWGPPAIERARIAEDRMWLAMLSPAPDPASALDAARSGLRYTERALADAPNDAAAMEIRGVLSYWVWLLTPERDERALRYLQQAEASLRATVAIDPSRGHAWSTLSALLLVNGVFAEANWAAEQALRADAYLENPRSVLVHLFATAYEIGDDEAAARWCEEIQRRFPGEWIGADCQIQLIAWVAPLDPRSADRAWALVRRYAAGPEFDDRTRARLELLVANVLARAMLRDSADAVIRRARARAPNDRELWLREASARTLMGQADSAVAILAAYFDDSLGAGPAGRRGVLRSRRFLPLRSHPTFKALMRGPPSGPAGARTGETSHPSQ